MASPVQAGTAHMSSEASPPTEEHVAAIQAGAMARRVTASGLILAALLLLGPAVVQAQTEEHHLSQSAVEIARPFGFPVTNSMIVTWLVAVGLIVFAQLATRHMKEVPQGSQNFLEWLVESLYGFLEGLLGGHLAKQTFWFFATVFIFILASNWVGLIPGVG